VRAARSFNDRNAFDAAGAIAFYALFSLFPLLLLLIVIGSFWLESEAVQFQLLRLVAYALPGSLDYLAKVIDEVLALQRTASLIGVIGLLWSATGVFHALAYNISAAWQPHKARGYFAGRFIALLIVGILAGLLFLSIVSTVVVDLLAQGNISIVGLNHTYTISPGQILSRILPVSIRLLAFLGIYRWIPNTKVAWIEALWGAFVAALGWELTTIGFTWYLGSRWGQFELIYGSLGTIIGLMLWVYIGSLITLFGAHLAAAVAHHRQVKHKLAARQEMVYEAQSPSKTRRV
jgi:membrane protein